MQFDMYCSNQDKFVKIMCYILLSGIALIPTAIFVGFNIQANAGSCWTVVGDKNFNFYCFNDFCISIFHVCGGFYVFCLFVSSDTQ